MIYALTRVACRVLLGTVWRLQAVGADNVPRRGPLIVACNHVSYFDPPALGVAAPRPIAYMAKRQLFDIPVFGPYLRELGAFPVDRSRGDTAAFKAAVNIVAGGQALGIFPEGTRNIDGSIKAQMGVALLAARTGAPVVPAFVAGTRHVNRFAPIRVGFGAPMHYAGTGKARRDDLANWTEELMVRIRALGETL